MSLPVATTDAGLAAVAAAAMTVPSVPSVAARAIAVAVVWTVLTLVAGGVLVAAFPSATRAIRDDVVDRTDLAFAAGFVVFFAPLVLASLPLFVLSYVGDHPAVLALGALVSLPSLLLWGLALLVGGALGVVTAGDRIARRFGAAAPSLERSLAIGIAVVGATQLVPILGVLIAMVLATLGTGAAVRRRFDVTGAGGARDPTTDAGPVDWEPADSSGTAVWRSSDEAATDAAAEPGSGSARAGTGAIDLGADDAGSVSRDRPAGSRVRDGGDAAGIDGDGTVEDWEWNVETDRADDDVRGDRDERRSGSERRERSE